MTKNDVLEIIAHIAKTASQYGDDDEVDISLPIRTQSGIVVEIYHNA